MRLIDADALIVKFKDDLESLQEFAFQLATIGAINTVKHQPTVDAVPVVRCKDCAYYRPYSDGRYDCDNMLGMADAYEDGFCSRAERKEE